MDDDEEEEDLEPVSAGPPQPAQTSELTSSQSPEVAKPIRRDITSAA